MQPGKRRTGFFECDQRSFSIRRRTLAPLWRARVSEGAYELFRRCALSRLGVAAAEITSRADTAPLPRAGLDLGCRQGFFRVIGEHLIKFFLLNLVPRDPALLRSSGGDLRTHRREQNGCTIAIAIPISQRRFYGYLKLSGCTFFVGFIVKPHMLVGIKDRLRSWACNFGAWVWNCKTCVVVRWNPARSQQRLSWQFSTSTCLGGNRGVELCNAECTVSGR